jgi:hypothetical protein
MLNVFAGDLSTLPADGMTIVLSPHLGLSQADFDELKMIMAKRHPRVTLRYI